jgi:hypothetical protein
VAEWWVGSRAAGAAATLPEAFRLAAAVFGDRLRRLIGA